MRKSSLGRRSSTHIPVRIPSLGASGQRICSGGKQSTSQLKQPGFTQVRSRRSQSDDRESYGGRPPMVRSSTAGTLPGRGTDTMTPITPRQSLHSNLPSGSVRGTRTMSTESNRMSSFGGTKNTRKDSRPITEKPFQQGAQVKVQNYFNVNGSQIMAPGTSIRPMNTKLFIDLVDHLLKNIDARIFITKSNYLEDLPPLLRKIGYRSKIDRSWLMTVNTQHSWQHVIALLSWLVEIIECINCVDPFDMMYPNISEPEEVAEDEMNISKEVIVHLKRTYRLKGEPNADDVVDKMNLEFIENQIVALRCTDEDFEVIQREIDLLKEDVDNEAQRRDIQLQDLEKLQLRHNAVSNDYKETEEFIEKSKTFVTSTEVKLATLEQEITVKKTILAKKQEELKRLQEKVSNQQFTLEEKEKMTKEKHDLLRMIQYYENGIREYEKSLFTVDLKFAEDQRKLEKIVVEYNKLVAEKIILEPRLKDVEVKYTLLSKTDDTLMDAVDSNLKSLIEEYKNSLQSLNLKKEECENILWRVKQDKKETEEEIAKQTSLLEGIECDLEKQEELINKETQKLKEEQNRFQKLTKEIEDEMSQFDQSKVEDKKLELKKIEHDWELLQKRTKQLLEGQIAISREGHARVEVAMKKLSDKSKEFKDKHLK